MRILLSRTDRIGDLVLSTPAIATVRASFPDAHITMVTSAYNRVAVERNGDVDEVVDLPLGVKPQAFGARYRGYDLAVALAPRATDVRLVGGTRASLRVGYTYVRRYLARLTAPLYLNRTMLSQADPDLCERDPSLVVRHEVDQLLDLVELGGATQRVARLRLDVNDADRAALGRMPAGSIVLHLGGRWFHDGSTLGSTVELARGLRTLGRPLTITYAPDCKREAAAIERAGVADAMLTDLPFYQWAAAFEKASCIVTVDTGATHVASAMRRPTVVVYEHRHFRLCSQEWAPYGVPYAAVRKPANDDDASLARLRAAIVAAVTTLME
ncbi:MAG TPA: glycosyltransferase family 9 protein [Verrucomicrobiae bacterium]|jgi:ADP-heptose:LPS heptosyltransferase|nr:glycosyltransferase family 9 protein [Verrucomicrobiae bacterium]